LLIQGRPAHDARVARLCLVMIARNEARCIERCLSSVREHVDAMHVLDTGSTDNTAALAARAGAQVSHYHWCNDFAAARNAALDQADAQGGFDWALVLDADEWLVQGGAVLQGVRAQPPDHVGVLRVDNLYGASAAQAACSTSWLSRLLPRGARYEGRIHEQPQAHWPRRRVDVTVRHDGYLDASMQAKRGRNEALLRLALRECPGDAYLNYQLGKDLELRGRFAQALPHYERAQRLGTAGQSWQHDLLLRTLFTLKRLRRHGAAVELAQAQMVAFGDSPDYCFALGDVLLDWAACESARGPELVPLIEAAWQRALAIGERPDLPDSVRGRGSFLAAHNLAVLYEGLNQREQALHWRARECELRAVQAAA
jgi:tetratricopeptide (TPR) repeat protein